jgi:sialic acid synthase
MDAINVVAEIGCNHGGDLDRAKKLIKLAALSGAQFAKFQKRNPKESTPQKLWDQPHPNQRFAFGKTYLEHRENLELSISQHRELKEYCDFCGIGYASSVWDMTSAIEIASLNPKFIKIPSAQNHNIYLLNYLHNNFAGQIHISFGMTTSDERQALLRAIYRNQEKRHVVYHCTSSYPCPFENLYLYEIKKLKDSFLNVGFSNHGYGIAADVAALSFGATWFERHFVDDRLYPHTDASASLEPEGLRKLVRDLNNVQKAFTSKPVGLCDLEQEQRDKLRS